MHDAYRHGAGGTKVLGAGILGGIVLSAWTSLPAWAAFLAGALPALILVALVHTSRDDEEPRE